MLYKKVQWSVSAAVYFKCADFKIAEYSNSIKFHVNIFIDEYLTDCIKGKLSQQAIKLFGNEL